MENFTPVSAALGGALIGLSAALLILLTGRIAGISGIFGASLAMPALHRNWSLAFLVGLIATPFALGLFGLPLPAPLMPSLAVCAAAGLLVGFGTRISGGCTSGHGICGLARLSPRSVVATAVFMAVAVLTVALRRHGLGG